MCTLRALFIIQDNEIALSCRYPIIEKKLELLETNYIMLPHNGKLLKAFKTELKHFESWNKQESESTHQIEIIENQSDLIQKYNINMFDSQKGNWFHFVFTLDGQFWPCIFFQQMFQALVLLPFIAELYEQNVTEENKNLILSQSFCFQACLGFSKSFMSFLNKEFKDQNSLSDIKNVLSYAIPYGTVIDDDFQLIMEVMQKQNQQRNKYEQSFNNYLKSHDMPKIPQFKIFFQDTYFKRQSIDITIQEEIISYQFNNPRQLDYNEIRGKVKCSVFLQDNPEITLPINGFKNEILDNFRLHVPGKIFRTENIHSDGLQISFYPQLRPFDLCVYHSYSDFEIPIKSSYQSKEVSPNTIKILVNLNINSNVLKKIDDIKIQIYFKKYHFIINTDLDVQVGKVKCFQKNETLLWVIKGKQLNQNYQDIILTGTVYLQQKKIEQQQINIQKSSINQEQMKDQTQNKEIGTQQQFNISNNNKQYQSQNDFIDNYALKQDYIDIKFNIKDYTYSKLQINPNDVKIYPHQYPNIKLIKQSFAKQYFAYNMLNSNFIPFAINEGDKNYIQKVILNNLIDINNIPMD